MCIIVYSVRLFDPPAPSTSGPTATLPRASRNTQARKFRQHQAGLTAQSRAAAACMLQANRSMGAALLLTGVTPVTRGRLDASPEAQQTKIFEAESV